MRVISGWIALFISLNALELQVNFGKEKNENFSVLNLSHHEVFACQENRSVYDEVTSIVCRVKTMVDNFIPTNTTFFGIETSVEDQHVLITITPKYKMQLFSTFLDLKQGASIPKERPEKSKQWQIIGYISQIPFLSGKQTRGLNFPIKIPSNQNLYIGQLDLNLKPLRYQEGMDFKKLKNIREDYERRRYANVIKDVDLALSQYPTSIFRRDFLLYKIRSLSHNPTKDNIDTIVLSSLDWVRNYPLEKNIPEVLYLLANAYAYNHLNNESNHYLQRILNEYPNTDWSALSKMQLAKNFAQEEQFGISNAYFSEAYNEAKSRGIKDQILIQWGLSQLRGGDGEGVKIIDDVIAKNPDYFIAQKSVSLALIRDLISHKLYHQAAEIASYLIHNLPANDEDAMQLSFNIGEWYALDGNRKQAHQYNELFLKKYPESKQYQQVVSRNHNLLFQMGDEIDNEKRLALLDEIITQYPQSAESKSAYLQKAQILFDLKRFNEVLQIQNEISGSPLIAKSKSHIILDLLDSDQCKQIPLYFQGSDLAIFKESAISLFDCLYSIAYYKEAKSLIPDLNNETLEDRLPWSYRLSKVLNKLGDFVLSRSAGADTLDIAKTLDVKQYDDIGFVIFDDLIKLKLTQQAQTFSLFLQENFKEDERMLSVWYALLQIAQQDKNPNSVQIYAQEILNLQEKTKNFELSPIVDFVLIDSLMQNKDYKKAQSILSALLEKKIEPRDMQKALYMQGSILRALGEQGYKESFEKCLEIQEDSSWKNLCSKSLEFN